MAEPVLKPIDQNLPPVVNVSLEEWNNLFDVLNALDPTRKTRNRFALTGHFPDPNSEARPRPILRANFDSSTCEFRGHMDTEERTDVDSVIALMMGNIPIEDEVVFEYFPLPDVRQTLNSDYHVPGVAVNDGRRERIVPIHKIPNARFAQVKGKLVRIHFTGLCEDEDLARQQNTNYVPRGRLGPLYNRAFLPAARDVLPAQYLQLLPPSFEAEEFRGKRGGRGDGDDDDDDNQRGPPTYQQSGKPIPGAYVQRLIERFRFYVGSVPELEWAVGFFFVLEGKGLKAHTSHPAPHNPIEDVNTMPADNRRRIAVHRALEGFNVAVLSQGRLYLDIATTVWAFQSVDDNDPDPDLQVPVSCFANAYYHPEILNYFTGTPINECERAVQSSSMGYSKDECAHLGDLAGGRYNVQNPTNGVEHFQLYDSSKGIVYNLVLKKNAKRTSPFRCMSCWKKERTEHFIPLTDAFVAAGQTHSVSVRLESRVEYSAYGRVHLYIPSETLSRWLFYLQDGVYWGYKSRRALAMHDVIHEFMMDIRRLSITSHQVREHGSLIIILVWMANALVNRPDDGGHWDEVRDSASVHGEVDDQVVPLRPLTMFYLHSLNLDYLPRISSHRTISPKTIAYLCSSGQVLSTTRLIAMLQGRYSGSQSQDRAVENTPEVITGDVWGEDHPDDLVVSVPQVRVLPHRGNRQRFVNYGPVEGGQNLFEGLFPEQQPQRYPSEEVDPERRDVGKPLDERVSETVKMYPGQIFGKAPNRKLSGGRRESWSALGHGDVDYDTFCDASQPGKIFSSWVHCGYNESAWKATIEAYFPTLDEHDKINEKAKNGNAQGLHCLDAWVEWRQHLLSVGENVREIIIRETHKRISNEWKWLPWFQSNHLWKTGAVGEATPGKKPKGNKLGGPWIIFNPKFRGSLGR